MPKSKAHKYWNKFAAWAEHEGQVRVEYLEALEEFLVNPARIPTDAAGQVERLFEGWFLLDRRLTRARVTPIELFIKSHERRLKPGELQIYRRFASENRFGFFRVENVEPGESFEGRLMPDGANFTIFETEGSRELDKGFYVITRLVPFEDHWAMPSAVGVYPSDASYAIDRGLGGKGTALTAADLKPRDVLTLFMPKVDWAREGPARVKARAAMLLQRWGVGDITVGMVEEDILEAHERRETSHPLFEKTLARAPSAAEAEEMIEVLVAWWNLLLPKQDAEVPRGPKELMLLQDLQRVIGSEVARRQLDDVKAIRRLTETMTKEWLHAPQAELDGKTPLEVIGAERKALGNPREGLGVTIEPSMLMLGAGEREAAEAANLGTRYLMERKPALALEKLEAAYAVLKGHPAAFRLLGKMATAHVQLGHREEALSTLRAALKANPDYGLARDNLQLLESMSPKEFARKHRAGFFERMNVVGE